jgi:3'-phosphoadenosine 5'-phosphosulfate sulfotransferase (PAPS reductase)/FAD synthetase
MSMAGSGAASERRLLVSFSGGETSGYMTHWIKRNWQGSRYDRIAVVFANTGLEAEATLEFVRDCDERFGFETFWIEGVYDPTHGIGPRHKLVDFASAARRGEPFEQMIAKYGIPNAAFKMCTSNLKQQPIEDFARGGLGWPTGSYDLAIGIRADEIDRMSAKAKRRRIVYPLIEGRVRREDVLAWWERQNFRLRLKTYEGNCLTCWKKTDRKLFTIMRDHPGAFDWNAEIERRHGLVGAEFRKEPPPEQGYRRTFWRKSRTTEEFMEQGRAALADPRFAPAVDERKVDQRSFDFDLDEPGGCGESCEVFSDEDDT